MKGRYKMSSVDMIFHVMDFNESINNIEKSLIIKEGKSILNESYEVLNEGIIEGLRKISDAIRNLVDKFINWLKTIKNKIFKKGAKKSTDNSSDNKNNKEDISGGDNPANAKPADKGGKYPDLPKVMGNLNECSNEFAKTQANCMSLASINYRQVMNFRNLDDADLDSKLGKLTDQIGNLVDTVANSKESLNTKIEENKKVMEDKNKSYSSQELDNYKTKVDGIYDKFIELYTNNTSKHLKEVYQYAENISSTAKFNSSKVSKEHVNYNKYYSAMYKIQSTLAGMTSYMTSTGVKLYSMCMTTVKSL